MAGGQSGAASGRGILLMLMSMALFCSLDALAKLMLAHYPLIQVIWFRYAGQSLILLVFLAPRLTRILRTNFPRMQALRCGLQLATTGLFFASLPHIGLAEATALADLSPVLITLGAALFLGERLGPHRITGIGLAMIGALIIIRPGSGVFSAGALYAIGAAVGYAGFALATRWVGGRENPWTSLIYPALVGTAVTSVALPWVFTPIALAHLPVLLMIGLLSSCAQLCLIRAFTLAEAAAVAPFGYAGQVFAAGWGILLFGEYPDQWTVMGALVIVVAGLYVWHRETRAARAAA